MEIFNVIWQDFRVFSAVLLRVSVVLFLFPFFNAHYIPGVLKSGLALLLALLLAPTVSTAHTVWPDSTPGWLMMMLAELAVGMMLGMMIQIFFEGVQMMGHLVGFQTGFAIANVIDTHSGGQISIMANLAYMAALLLFLLLDGHHIVLTVLRQSFAVVPVGGPVFHPHLAGDLVQRCGRMFVLALKLGAPAIGVLLLTKVMFGLIVKFIPQMNIMIVAFPLQIVVGLFFFGISLNALLLFTEHFLGGLHELLMRTLSGWAV